MTPLDEFMAKDRNSYMVPVGDWRPQTKQYKEAFDDYKRWADNPAGSEWWGRCANASSDVAAKDCHNSDNTDDTAEDAVTLMTATITYEVVAPLTAGQNLIERVLQHKDQGLSIDQTYHVVYTAPEGMSEAQAAKNTKEAQEAERQIKECVAKWEKGCQTLKTQADAAAQKITDRTNPATVLVDGRKVLRDAAGPAPAGPPDSGAQRVRNTLFPGIGNDPSSTQPAAATPSPSDLLDPTKPKAVDTAGNPAAKPPVDPKSLGGLASLPAVEDTRSNTLKPNQPATRQMSPADELFDKLGKAYDGAGKFFKGVEQGEQEFENHLKDMTGGNGEDKLKQAWTDAYHEGKKELIEHLSHPGSATKEAIQFFKDGFNDPQTAGKSTFDLAAIAAGSAVGGGEVGAATHGLQDAATADATKVGTNTSHIPPAAATADHAAPAIADHAAPADTGHHAPAGDHVPTDHDGHVESGSLLDTSHYAPLPDAGPYALPERAQLHTPQDGAYFWSGRNDAGVGVGPLSANGNGAADLIADGSHATTLESLLERRGITPPEWSPHDPHAQNWWSGTSQMYAENASGEVYATIGSNLRPGNVWENVELPRLMDNPNITKIVVIDPDTGLETVVFER